MGHGNSHIVGATAVDENGIRVATQDATCTNYNVNNDLWTIIAAATAKGFNNRIKFMSESEVDPLIEKALSSDSDDDSDIDDDEVPLNQLKKKNNSAKKTA